MDWAALTTGGSSSLTGCNCPPAAPAVAIAPGGRFPDPRPAGFPPPTPSPVVPAPVGSLKFSRRRTAMFAPGAGVLKYAPGIWRIGVTGFIVAVVQVVNRSFVAS